MSVQFNVTLQLGGWGGGVKSMAFIWGEGVTHFGEAFASKMTEQWASG